MPWPPADITNFVGTVNATTGFHVAGTQVLTTQQAVIARVGKEPWTNNLVNMVNLILDVLEAHGLTASA